MILLIRFEEETGKITGIDDVKTSCNQEVNFDGKNDLDIFNYKYVDGQLIKLTEEEKEKFYHHSSGEDDITKSIKRTLNAMLLNVIPEGETLTPENVPSLIDIINTATTEESGTKENPIDIVDNDIVHNGYLCTYGKYYKWNNVVYQCKRTGESEGGTIKLLCTPDQLLNQYFILG